MHFILTKNSNSGAGFVKSKTIAYFTIINYSIIFTAQVYQLKSLRCRQNSTFSLFCPCDVWFWITSGIAVQVYITSLNSFFIWWSRHDLWENYKIISQKGVLHLIKTNNRNHRKKTIHTEV